MKREKRDYEILFLLLQCNIARAHLQLCLFTTSGYVSFPLHSPDYITFRLFSPIRCNNNTVRQTKPKQSKPLSGNTVTHEPSQSRSKSKNGVEWSQEPEYFIHKGKRIQAFLSHNPTSTTTTTQRPSIHPSIHVLPHERGREKGKL